MWSAIAAIATSLAAVFAGWAAFEAHRSVSEAARTTRAAVSIQLLNQYASPEMLAAMKELRAWQHQRPNDFSRTFQAMLVQSDIGEREKRRVDELDLSRRRVIQFFTMVMTLSEGGIVDESFVTASWGTGTYPFIAEVLVPLDQAKTRAMFEEKDITEQDRAASEILETHIVNYYKKIEETSLMQAELFRAHDPFTSDDKTSLPPLGL